MVRKKWEGEAWPRVIVWHLYGFIVAAFLYLGVPGDSLLSKHAVQEVPLTVTAGGEVVHKVAEEIVELDLVLLPSVLHGLEDAPGALPPHLQACHVAPVPSLDQDRCLEGCDMEGEASL